MSGVEFRLAAGDHRVVERFLATDPTGVSGIQLSAKYLRRGSEVAEAARTAGLEVSVDPLTERLVAPGLNPGELAYGDWYPIDPGVLSTPAARMEFVEAVVAPQLEVGTVIVPPHFFVESVDDLMRNVALVRAAVAEYGEERPIRPILAVPRSFLVGTGAEAIAARYVQAGVETLELRISPLGGQDNGPIKIRTALTAVGAIERSGLEVRLGSSGLVGHAAMGLGVASGFSVGVGYGEKYNHKDALRRQVSLAEAEGDEEDEDRDGPRGPQALVRLPGAEIAVPRATAEKLYENRQIRSRLACSRGPCSDSLDGPIRDARTHYLHSWSGEVADTLSQPPSWRASGLRDRLIKAQQFRDVLWKHLPKDAPRPKSATLDTLVAEIDRHIQRAA